MALVRPVRCQGDPSESHPGVIGEILMKTCKTLLRPQRGRGEVTPVGQLHPPQPRGSAKPLRCQFLRQAPNYPLSEPGKLSGKVPDGIGLSPGTSCSQRDTSPGPA